MFKNYLRVAFRTLLRNKSYVGINTIGLGISLACCITAYLLLANNIEFNDFYDDQKTSAVFMILTHSTEKDGRKMKDAQAPTVMAPIAREQIAGIRRYTRFIYGDGAMRYGDKAFNESIAFADSAFFDMFEHPMVSGSTRAFKDKNSIFISEKLARRYFGDEDPLGKLMVLNFVNNKQIEVLVGGVVGKIAPNTSFPFQALMRIENFMDVQGIAIDDWSDWRNPSTFLELEKPENAPAVARQLGKYIANRNKLRTDMVVDEYTLLPFKHNLNNGEIRYGWVLLPIDPIALIVFCSMAGLILLIACFNLTNTSIAMTAKRLKEVGVRKVVGAARYQVVTQFLLETVIVITFSAITGVMIAQFIVPAFTAMWNLDYGLEDLNGINFFIAIIVMIFLAAMLAGLYPALFSSKFKPVALLKGGVKISGTNVLTRSLVAAQFALSVIVLIAGVTFIMNSRYQEQITLGYDKDEMVSMVIQGEREYDAMKAALERNPKVLAVGVADGNLGRSSYQTPISVDTAKYDCQVLGVGEGFFEVSGLRFAEGQPFLLGRTDEREKEGGPVVVNQAFLQTAGIQGEPLNREIKLHNVRRVIVGVVDNHIDNLYRSNKPEPYVFYPCGKNQYISLLVKAKHEDLPEVNKIMEKTWKEVMPGHPFESMYQDDIVYQGSRRTNASMKQIFLFITILGALLSASGIFALASLNIARRTKEIGIRRALGASVQGIVALLNREFAIILLVAAIIGSVAGYFLTDALISELYAYHIPVGLIPVVLCALTIFAVGILTTCSTVLKAAQANPVKTLRSE
jgi:ABC-type antimicrobial peptide transport system permease subunit